MNDDMTGGPESNMKRPENAVRSGPAGAVGFSLIELLTVISIIGVLAAIGTGMAGVASRKMKESRIRADLHNMITAIEDFKSTFNQYPPDNVRRGETTNFNPNLNQLFYELTGTMATNSGQRYHSADASATTQNLLPVSAIYKAFNTQGFINAANYPERPKNFLRNLRDRDHKRILLAGSDTPVEVLVVPVDWPANLSPAPIPGTDPRLRRVNPWRYVSTQPTNNPGSFDLWAEYVIGKQRRVIGNWKE